MLPFLLFALVLTLGWVVLAFLAPGLLRGAGSEGFVRRLSLAGAVLCLGLALIGCSRTPTGPSDITIINQNTNTQNSPNPTGSPSTTPGAGDSLPAGSQLRAGFFGISCSSGTPPRNQEGRLPLACTAVATCTPKSANGTDLPIEVTGPDASWRVDVGPANVDMTNPDGNPYNRAFAPRSVGPVRAICTVKNLSASFEFSVVN